MTSLPHSSPLSLTCSASQGTVRVELRGDLDHLFTDRLLDVVDRVLAEHRPLRHLRLDFTGLTGVDSSGLAALLMVRRRTDAVGTGLHLDGRTVQLNRLLEVTGTLEHLTAPGVRSARSRGPETSV
ncbi:STAS domain-containing protein [Streptomyces sp. NPDC048606]|uniref:STAS domain-containing protein n=1 Tax=Streptomyces sp. NPDC048606 TaxID=3154726 RepID=UPI00343617C8